MSESIVVQQQNGAIAQQSRGTQGAVVFSPEQRKLIRDTFANGASDPEFAALMAVAERRGLDPFLRQVYFVKRWDSQKRCEVWAVQASIDGLRAIAQRTGIYDGQDEPEFEHDERGGIKLCRVRIYRKDWARPAVGVAYWSEYAQSKKEGGLTSFWATKGHIMIAKCAEALALRKAFPEDTSGIYIPEEMGQERQERDVTPKQARPVVVVQEVKRKELAEVAPRDGAQQQTVSALLHACRQGFTSRPHRDNWGKKHAAEIAQLPKDVQAVIREAYTSAPIGKEPPHDPATGEVLDGPPPDAGDEPPLTDADGNPL